jgi:hypothetical protein
MLIYTTKGEIDSDLLCLNEIVTHDANNTTIITEYSLNGEIVRKDSKVTLKPLSSTSEIGKI